MKTKLILVRHAQSLAKEQNIVQGRGDNIALSELGKTQAQACAKALESGEFSRAFSSESLRALHTAQAFCALRPDVSLTTVPLLHERSKGVAEGISKDDFKLRYPEIEAAWENGEDPTVPQGESFENVEKRVMPILMEHISQYTGESLLYFTHGNVIRVIVGSILQAPYGLRGRIVQDYCAATTIQYDSERNRFEIIFVNCPLI